MDTTVQMSKQFKFMVTCGTPSAPGAPGDIDMFQNEQENHTITVSQIIERFCAKRASQERFSDPGKWALRWYHDPVGNKDQQGNSIPKRAAYITDSNKHIYLRTAPNVVYLSPPAETHVRTLLQQLEQGNSVSMENSLIQMNMSISDTVFAAEFVAQRGVDSLMKTLKEGTLTGQSLKLALQLFCEITTATPLFSVRNVHTDIVSIIVKQLERSDSETDLIQTVCYILNEILQTGVSPEIDNYVLAQATPYKLTHLLERDLNASYLISVLSLLNTVCLRLLKNDPAKFRTTHDDLNRRTRKYLYERGLTKNQKLVQQLAILQRLLLFPIADMYETSVPRAQMTTGQREDAAETARIHESLKDLELKVEELRQYAFEPERFDASLLKKTTPPQLVDISGSSDQLANTSGSIVPKITREQREAQFAQLGFANVREPLADFASSPPGSVLPLVCIRFMALKEVNKFRQIVKENVENTKDAPERQLPLVRVSCEITNMLYEALRVPLLDDMDSATSRYMPFLFSDEHAFEMAFCVCVGSAQRVFRDMKANERDLDQVLKVVREQIDRTLATAPETLVVFKNKMYHDFAFSKLARLWEHEDAQDAQTANAHLKAELERALQPEMLKLIKEQRFNIMMRGQVFLKNLPGSGDRARLFQQVRRDQNMKFMFCCLSQNQKVLLFSDIDDPNNPPRPEQLIKPSQFFVDSIAQFIAGHECPHVKEAGRKVRSGEDLFAFSLMSLQGDILNFVARDQEAYDIWTDGIIALHRNVNEMQSSRCKQDLKDLLAIEIKVRLMELENFNVPDKPPTLPPDPPNYDFDLSATSDG